MIACTDGNVNTIIMKTNESQLQDGHQRESRLRCNKTLVKPDQRQEQIGLAQS